MKFLSDILAKAGLTVDGVVTLNNTATGQTPAANDNSTKLATTAWVRGFVTPYSLPIASGLTLGGIKIGSGLAIDGTGIVSVAATGVGAIRALQQFTATAGQTVFTVSGGYTPGLIDVFLNGVLLTPTSITASNGTTFTLSDAALVNDVLDVFVYNPIYGGFISSTDQVPEGTTNLYFTNARARAAITLTTTGTSGAATYNSSTGVLNIPSYIGGVVSIFGRTGTVVAVSGDYTTALVTEVTNLYYTDARARAAISVTGSGSYDSATGIITVTGGVTSVNTLTGAVTLTTTNIAEGTNLYYTDARVGTYLTTNSYATQTYVGTQIANLVASAPATLDTLNELATALGNDPSFATTVATSIGTKVPQTRTITINGTAYDLSADRSWTVGVSPSARTIQTYTATAAQTTFTVTGGYVVGLVDVFINGVRLTSADFTATNGTTVVLTTGTGVNNIVDVIKYTSAFTASSALRQVTYFTATAGQTSFTVSYTPGLVDVFYNGSKLAASEYTASNGTSVVIANAAVLNDSIEVISYAYSVGAFTGLSTTRTLTINGTSYDLSADRTWSIDNASLGAQPQLNGTGLVRMSGTTVSYDNATYATQSYVTTAVANLVNAAPSTLDTLNELATALGNDANFATTITTSIGTKQAQLNGTGFVKISGTTISYDNSTYLTTASASSTYLPLTGGTLTGDLSIAYTTSNLRLFLNNTTATTGRSWYFNSYSNGNLYVGNTTAGDIFNFSSAGVATFSAALTGTSATFTSGLIVSNTADVYPEFKTSAIDADAFLGFSNTGDANNAWSIGRRNTGEFWISNYTGNFNSGTRTQPLVIASTGAATFSNDVTTRGTLYIGASSTGDVFVSPSNGYMYFEYPTSYGAIFRTQGGTEAVRYLSSGQANFANIIRTDSSIQVGAGSNNYYTQIITAYNYPYVDSYFDSVAGASYEGRLNFRTNTGGGAMSTKLTIANSGAATFSGTVNTVGLLTGQASIYQADAGGLIASNRWGVYNGGATTMRFLYNPSGAVIWDNGSDRMTLSNFGQLGVRTTPNGGWGSSIAAIQVGTGGVLTNWTGANNNFGIGVNYYDNGSGSQLRLNSGGVSKIDFNNSDIIFSNAVSSSANSSISFITRMSLQGNGALVVGRTLGNQYSQTSTSGSTSIVDTGITYDTGDYGGYSRGATYQVVFAGNPNAGGSGAYYAQYMGILMIYTGWSGSNVTTYIQYTQLTGGNNIGALTLTPYFWNGSSQVSSINVYTGGYQIRLRIDGYNSSYVGSDQSVYLTRLT